MKVGPNKIAVAGALLLSGCATTHQYAGSILDCESNPIAGAEIEAWKNSWVSFRPAEMLVSTASDSSGRFELHTRRNVSFFVFAGRKLVMETHPEKSEDKCEIPGT